MSTYWYYGTGVGQCRIVLRPDGRYHAFLGEDDLGSYATPQQALDDLVGGHTFTPSSGVDTAALGLPDDLGEWTLVRGTA
jgi:hypothetical protein